MGKLSPRDIPQIVGEWQRRDQTFRLPLPSPEPLLSYSPLLMVSFICSFVHPSIHPPIHPSIIHRLPIDPSITHPLFIHPSIQKDIKYLLNALGLHEHGRKFMVGPPAYGLGNLVHPPHSSPSARQTFFHPEQHAHPCLYPKLLLISALLCPMAPCLECPGTLQFIQTLLIPKAREKVPHPPQNVSSPTQAL